MKRTVDFSLVKCSILTSLCSSFSDLAILSYLKNIFMFRHAEEVRKCKESGRGASNTEKTIGHWRAWKLAWREVEDKENEFA